MPQRTLTELATAAGGSVRGPGDLLVGGVNTLVDAGNDQITWASQNRYRDALEKSRAAAVVVPVEFGPTPMPAILCPDPELGILRILELFAPPVPAPPLGRDASAHITDDAEIGADSAIGPNVVVGAGARIGSRTVLHANVFVGDESVIGDDCVLWPGVIVRERCTLGNRIIIHSNAVIGTDGFGYHYAQGGHQKIPQIGTVQIEDDVEIGAGTCIDRAKLGATVIGAGSKIDNLVQIGHNVQIGPQCIVAGQAGLSGSVRLGSGVLVGGQAGFSEQQTVGDGAQVGGGAAVVNDIPAGASVMGFPARDSRVVMRENVLVRRLPELATTLKDLIKRVEQLEAAADHS